jgi:hypothetical protein
MKVKWLFPALAALLALLGVSLQFGCEGDDDIDTDDVDSYFASHPYVSDPRDSTSPSDVVISPTSATASYVGQAITFIAKGGSGSYSWDVANGNGHISSIISQEKSTSSAIYVADAVGPNTVIVFDKYGHSAVASVGTGSTTAPSISPASGSCASDGATISFTASGGVPPYTWTLLNGNGTLNTLTGSSVLYTRTSAGDNGVTATDAAGASASAAISQP